MTPPRSLSRHVGRAGGVAALGLVATTAYFGFLAYAQRNWDYDQWMVIVLLPVLLASGVVIIRAITRHDSLGLANLMIVALIVKLAATFVRYFVVFELYGAGDATGYNGAGTRIANAFHDGDLSIGEVITLGRQTEFIEDLTGLFYIFTGPSRLGGFLLFSWVSFWGLVLFHRAARIGVPELDERRYALMLYFMPSLVFWPSSIGKEAVMILALGLCAYGAARFLTHQQFGLAPLAAGLGVAYIVRPHVAFVVVAGVAVAVLFRRNARASRPIFGPAGRLAWFVVVAAVAAFTLGQATERLLPASESSGVGAAGELLDRATDGTDSGDSTIEGTTPNSPLEYPQAVFSVLFRPTILEARTAGNAVAAAETTVLLLLFVASWRRLKNLPVLLFKRPYLVLAVVYAGIFTFAWSSFANLGALARQRAQVWPFVLLVLALPVVVKAPDTSISAADVLRGRGRQAADRRSRSSLPLER